MSNNKILQPEYITRISIFSSNLHCCKLLSLGKFSLLLHMDRADIYCYQIFIINLTWCSLFINLNWCSHFMFLQHFLVQAHTAKISNVENTNSCCVAFFTALWSFSILSHIFLLMSLLENANSPWRQSWERALHKHKLIQITEQLPNEKLCIFQIWQF